MNKEIYSSQDFYLTAFLVASGQQILTYDRRSSITTFEFELTNELSQLVREYYADQATISPIRYGNSLKNIKSIIHSNTNTNDNYITHKSGVTK